MTFESIRDAALLLPPEQREVLGEILLWSVHPKLDLTPAQAEDLARRVAEEDAGLAETIPWEVVREELRKKSDR